MSEEESGMAQYLAVRVALQTAGWHLSSISIMPLFYIMFCLEADLNMGEKVIREIREKTRFFCRITVFITLQGIVDEETRYLLLFKIYENVVT